MTREDRKLKNCPFCGGEAKLDNYMKWWVVCKKCRITSRFFESEEYAIEAWNRRVGETE